MVNFDVAFLKPVQYQAFVAALARSLETISPSVRRHPTTPQKCKRGDEASSARRKKTRNTTEPKNEMWRHRNKATAKLRARNAQSRKRAAKRGAGKKEQERTHTDAH